MRKVCVFTSTRADYGLLMNLMKLIRDDDTVDLQILVTGTHLLKDFGETFRAIEADGFSITSKVLLDLSDSSELGICRSQGQALELFGKELLKLRPDISIVLGDRFEALSFAIACTNMGVALAHIHGGELTLGATDDAFRHSITKMSYLHFTASEGYKKRVIRLGENPKRVFNFGAPGVENIHRLKLLGKVELGEKMKIPWKKNNLLITFHPETNSDVSVEVQIENLLQALMKTSDDTLLIFTGTNADAGRKVVETKINSFIQKNSSRCISFTSMGQLNYLSALQFVDVVVGNSSSGIIEVPSFKIPTVNIGDRQKGRERAETIIDCGHNSVQISAAIEQAINYKKNNHYSQAKSPFDGGLTSESILKVLKEFKVPANLQKEFYEELE